MPLRPDRLLSRRNPTEKGRARLLSSVVEHSPCKRKVVSSILTGGSIKRLSECPVQDGFHAV